jgi:hypothetical protein
VTDKKTTEAKTKKINPTKSKRKEKNFRKPLLARSLFTSVKVTQPSLGFPIAVEANKMVCRQS